MITKGMGLRREDVYIANILKCRPPENRDPQPDECANCLPYLERQLEIIRPEFLCLLGRVAAQNLLQTTVAMGKLRKSMALGARDQGPRHLPSFLSVEESPGQERCLGRPADDHERDGA